MLIIITVLSLSVMFLTVMLFMKFISLKSHVLTNFVRSFPRRHQGKARIALNSFFVLDIIIIVSLFNYFIFNVLWDAGIF